MIKNSFLCRFCENFMVCEQLIKFGVIKIPTRPNVFKLDFDIVVSVWAGLFVKESKSMP